MRFKAFGRTEGGLTPRGLADWGDSIEQRLARGQVWYLIYFSLLFLALVSARAAQKLMWFDELHTYNISRLPGLGAIWKALVGGADLNPPLIYFVTHALYSLIGDGPIATRLPEILGFLVMCLCLYGFLSRRCGPVWGLVGMLFPLLSGACEYAYEARPYGLVLGSVSVALLAWQAASEGRERGLALAGIFLGCTLALASHAYAGLALSAIAAGELVRTWRAKRIDWPVWLAFAAAAPAVALYLPLLRISRPALLQGGYLAPKFSSLAESYDFFLAPALWPLLAALLICAAPWRPRPASGDAGYRRPAPVIPLHEMVVAVCFVLLPVLMVALTRFSGRIFLPRYALSAVIGIAILFTVLARERAGEHGIRGVLVAALLLGCFLGREFMELGVLPPGRSSQRETALPGRGQADPDQIETGLPFVAGNGLQFLQLDHYATPTLASRLFYLRNPRAAARYSGTDWLDSTFPEIEKWYPLRGKVDLWGSFASRHRRFLVYGVMEDPLGWLIPKLIDDGAEMRLRGRWGANLLWEVTLPQAPESGSAPR